MLEDLHVRLSGVLIECLDWREFIDRYDGPGTLFYLGPPYFGGERHYGAEMFSRDDFPAIAGRLAAIEGKFILSLNDHAEARRIFGEFSLREVTTGYTVNSRGAGEAPPELVISNADLTRFD